MKMPCDIMVVQKFEIKQTVNEKNVKFKRNKKTIQNLLKQFKFVKNKTLIRVTNSLLEVLSGLSKICGWKRMVNFLGQNLASGLRVERGECIKRGELVRESWR